MKSEDLEKKLHIFFFNLIYSKKKRLKNNNNSLFSFFSLDFWILLFFFSVNSIEASPLYRTSRKIPLNYAMGVSRNRHDYMKPYGTQDDIWNSTYRRYQSKAIR